jgi:hypothetical protein
MRSAALLANTAWSFMNVPAYLSFARALHDPVRTQERLLLQLVRANVDTLVGRRYRFDAIRSIADFRDRVPICTYDQLALDIDRIARGEQGVLTHEPVVRLGESSGSVAARKLIPYTRSLQRQFNRAIGPWVVDLYRRDPQLAVGCAYWSITPVAHRERDANHTGPPIGFEEDSSYLGGVGKRLVDAVMAVPGDVRFSPDIASFRRATLRCLLARRDLRLISVWHPSFLELLLDAARNQWHDLLRDIADPTRARELESIGPDDWTRVWPGLRLISCWADGPAEAAARRLSWRFPGVTLQPKGLLATEAFVSIPFRGAWPVAVRSHGVEFVDDAGRPIDYRDLKPGDEAAVVVTTAGGLWRYRLGDRVRVDGFVDATPSIRFVGRSDRVVDLRGEKLSEGFVSSAVRAWLAQHHLDPPFVMLTPTPDRDGYVLYLDCTRPIDPTAMASLDEHLRANPHYAYARELGQLKSARVRCVDRAYEQYTTTLTQAGLRLGDIKPSILSDRSEWAWARE